MKNLFALVSILVFALLIASCSKKEYTCNCLYKDAKGNDLRVSPKFYGTSGDVDGFCNNIKDHYQKTYGNYADVICEVDKQPLR